MGKDKKELWKGAYYPLEFVSNKRTKVLLSLLFDKVVCHFPVAGMVCGGGHGCSQIFEDDLLVKSGVIELEEELLLDEVDELFRDAPTNGWWPKNFDKYVSLQITGMALLKSQDASYVPVTDNPNLQVPALMLNELNITNNAKLQAVAAAVASIELVLPPLIEMEDEDILRLRDELSEHLIPFRSAMLALAPQIRTYLTEGASMHDVYQEAKYVIDTTVQPNLTECRAKIEKEKGAFWRRIVMKSAGILPRFAVSWAEKSIVSAAVDAASEISQFGAMSIENHLLSENMKRQGGFGFLLNLEEKMKP